MFWKELATHTNIGKKLRARSVRKLFQIRDDERMQHSRVREHSKKEEDMGSRNEKTWQQTEWGQMWRGRRDPDNSESLCCNDSEW